MAFTSTDLTNVETAIIALATGERVVQVNIADKLIKFSDVQIDELRILAAQIKMELGLVYTRTYGKQGGRASS